MITGIKNYNADQRQQLLGRAAIGATDVMDVYVGGLKAFAPLTGSGATAATVGCVGLVVGHAAAGFVSLSQASDMAEGLQKTSLQSAALGEFLTALGFAGLGMGLGPWALPIVGLGMVTTNFCRLSGGGN